MRRVLINDQLETQFHQDGFVTIDLLNNDRFRRLEEIIAALNKEYKDSSIEKNSTYKLSYFNNDFDFKKRIFNTITDFIQPIIDERLKNYKPLIINIFDKEPGKGEVTIHQNWSFVDETEFTSVSVWIPLVDVSRNNGTLEVVKGSHKVLCQYRSPSLPWVFDDLNTLLKEKYLEPFVLNKGQAAIIDDGILHWSSDNLSDHVRTAVQLIMVPDDATPIHYVNQGDHVDVYKVDADFFMKYDMKNIPIGYSILDQKKIELTKLSEKEFVDKIAINNPEIRKKYTPIKKKTLLEKIFGN